MDKANTNVYRMLSTFDKMKWSLAGKGVLCGLVAGFLVVLYRLGVDYGSETVVELYAYFKLQPIYLIPWTAAIILAGLLIAKLIDMEPMASGSGIPQVEGVVLLGLKMKWGLVLAVRYIAGILAAFFGLSFGPEGPSIQIGAAGSQAVAERVSKSRMEQNYLITGGAAAGLAAAFNAPLSGMVFALEEVHRSFSPLVLLSATTAALTADYVSKYFFGLKPSLYFTNIPQLPINLYIWLIPLGIFAGLSGALMNKSLLFTKKLYSKLPRVSAPIIALLITIPCGLFLPQLLGSGHELAKFAEEAQGHPALVTLGVLLLGKIIFTSTSFGSGTPGGIFMPILAVGTLAGSIIGIIATHFGLPSEYIASFAIYGMAATLAASAKAPITSILLTAELSGSFVHMLPVAACTFLALFLSDILKVIPIYEALLEQFIHKHGQTLPTQERGGIFEFPVEYGSLASEHIIKDIKWPEGSLVVGLRRGEKELIPNGTTKLMPGDYVIILSPENVDELILREKITSLCHTCKEPIEI